MNAIYFLIYLPELIYLKEKIFKSHEFNACAKNMVQKNWLVTDLGQVMEMLLQF